MLYIVSLDEMKTLLGIDDANDDEELILRLEPIQGRFDAHCNRRFLYSASATELFDGGRTWLEVAHWPINAVASIHVDQDQDWTSDTLISADDYVVNFGRGRISYAAGTSRWTAGEQHIRVVYSGGMFQADTTAAPNVDEYDRAAVRRAFMMQAEFEWRNRRSIGLNQVSAQGVSQQQGAQPSLALKDRTLLPDVETTLRHFRRI